MPYVRRTRGSTRRYGSRGSRSNRRVAVWVRRSGGAPATGNIVSPQVIDLLPNDYVDDGAKLGSTIVRIRGNISLEVSNGNGFRDNAGWAAGITVCPNADSPNPLTEADSWPWLWYKHLDLNTLRVALIYGTAPGQFYGWGLELDAKTMRRITQPSETLKLSIAAPTAMPIANWNDWFVGVSMLLKLS